MTAPRMSRIEMVMHLQAVDLFRSCAANEVIRLAQIAEPVRFERGEVVYRPSEPSRALFTVVSGSVLVEGKGGDRREVGPQGSFGVLEILSGRQRRSRAEAGQETTALMIQAEDLFDLLSNNIDIVKALFREILDDGSPRLARGGRASPEQEEPAPDRADEGASADSDPRDGGVQEDVAAVETSP